MVRVYIVAAQVLWPLRYLATDFHYSNEEGRIIGTAETEIFWVEKPAKGDLMELSVVFAYRLNKRNAMVMHLVSNIIHW